MNDKSRALPVRLVVGGAVAVAVILVVGLWLWSSAQTAPPGKQPAVPPQPGQTGASAAGQPTDGFGARLSSADADKVKRGETVKIATPGGGFIEVGGKPPK